MPKKAISFLIGIACWLTVASPFLAAEPEAQRKIVLTSAAFQRGADIPRKYTCDAEDVSPPLRWTNAPAATKSFALIADDPNAPGGTWVHWVIYDLPSEIKELAEAMPQSEKFRQRRRTRRERFSQARLQRPLPAVGSTHRYYFRLYALDAPTDVKARATKLQVLETIKGMSSAQPSSWDATSDSSECNRWF